MKKRILSLVLAAVVCLCPLSVFAAETPLYGDANNDGFINLKDVLAERRFLADLPTKLSLTLGDCNGDGAVNMKDVLILRQYLADIINRIEGKAPILTKKCLRSIYYYNGDGENTEINFYTYNTHGHLTLMTDRQPDGTLNWKKDFTYDGKNREILCVMTEDGERGIMTATTYDAAGRISAITRTNGAGETLRKTTFEYDTNGKRVAEYGFDANGKADDKTLYTYDEKLRLVKEETFGADGFFFGYVTYAYDKLGNTAEIKRYGAEKTLVGSEQFVYDAAGNLKTHIYNDELGRLDARVEYTYDNTGRLAQIVPYNFDGEHAEWKYAYTQKNAPLSAVCINWDGEILWKQTYQYIEVDR